MKSRKVNNSLNRENSVNMTAIMYAIALVCVVIMPMYMLYDIIAKQDAENDITRARDNMSIQMGTPVGSDVITTPTATPTPSERNAENENHTQPVEIAPINTPVFNAPTESEVLVKSVVERDPMDSLISTLMGLLLLMGLCIIGTMFFVIARGNDERNNVTNSNSD